MSTSFTLADALRGRQPQLSLSGERRLISYQDPDEEELAYTPGGEVLIQRIRLWCRTAELITADTISAEFNIGTRHASACACGLEQEGFLVDDGLMPSRGGRRPKRWKSSRR